MPASSLVLVCFCTFAVLLACMSGVFMLMIAYDALRLGKVWDAVQVFLLSLIAFGLAWSPLRTLLDFHAGRIF